MKRSKNQIKTCFGVDSQTEDKKNILYWDFDNIELNTVCYCLETQQEKYLLSNIYVIKTTNGYNAFSLDKMPFNSMIHIISTTKNIDSLFVKMSKHRKNSTLRFDSTKRLETIIKANSDYEKSLAHIIFFKEYLNYFIETQKPIDNLYNIRFTAYHSYTKGVENVKI